MRIRPDIRTSRHFFLSGSFPVKKSLRLHFSSKSWFIKYEFFEEIVGFGKFFCRHRATNMEIIFFISKKHFLGFFGRRLPRFSGTNLAAAVFFLVLVSKATSVQNLRFLRPGGLFLRWGWVSQSVSQDVRLYIYRFFCFFVLSETTTKNQPSLYLRKFRINQKNVMFKLQELVCFVI